jgi:CheY-like chemotaxis protein/signal transduction histidine kinase
MARQAGHVLPLLLWSLLIGALIAALGWQVLRMQSRDREALAQAELELVADHARARVLAWLGNRMDDAAALARSPSLQEVARTGRAEPVDATALNQELEARAADALDRVTVWAVAETSTGRVLAASRPTLVGQAINEAKQAAGRASIHAAQHSQVFQGPAFSIVAPLPAAPDALPAAVVGWIGLPALSRVTAPQETAGQASTSYLTDARGLYLSRPADATDAVVLQDRVSGPALEACRNGASGVATEIDVRGQVSPVVHHWLQQPGWCLFTRSAAPAPLTATAAVPRSLVLAGAGAWLLATLAGGVLLRWTQRRTVAKPAGDAPRASVLATRSAPRTPARSHAVKPSAAADEQANQFRNNLLTSVSHEIRTPMNGVLGPLALLLRSPLNERQQELAELAHASADELLRSIRDVIDGARLDAGELELAQQPFNPRQLVEQVAEALVAPAAIRHTEIELAHSSELPARVLGDEARCKQLLDHLFQSALHCCQSGRLKIDLRSFPGWPGFEVICLRISDGDPQVDHMQRLARQLTETDLSAALRSGGSGLALAICQALIKKMDGRFGGEGQPGSESAIWVEIPLRLDPVAGADGHGEPAPAGRAPMVLPNGPGVRALLVEDNRTNQQVGALMLRSLGCVVEVCDNGQQALERIDSSDFDIVFMDCEMPVMDGLSATRAIRQRSDDKRDLPIIAVTAQAMPGDRELCIEAGMTDYLSKPVLDTDFSAALWRWLPTRVAEEAKGVLSAKPAAASTAGAGQHSSALDPATVNRLLSLASATEPGLLEQIFDAFRHDSRGLIETMLQAIEARDGEALRPAAHMLKGASGTIGARGMVDLCEQLHQQGDGADWGRSVSLISQLQAEFARVLEALDRAQPAPRSQPG